MLEAIDHLDDAGAGAAVGAGYEHLEEELGDLLFQIVFHATLATEEGQFTLADVARTVHDKLRDRHPHVFGVVEVDGTDDVVANWEQLKKAEKGRESVFDGIPDALPALLFALKVQKKGATLGLEVAGDRGGLGPDMVGPDLDVVDLDRDTLGELLWAVVERARAAGLDPEDALRSAAAAQRDRLRSAELGGRAG